MKDLFFNNKSSIINHKSKDHKSSIQRGFMALKTTLEQLEEVQAAITEVMTSQSLTQPGGTVVRANLDALQKREEKLLARYRIPALRGQVLVVLERVDALG